MEINQWGDKFKIHRDAVLGERVYVTYIPNVTHWAPLPKLPLPLVDIQSNIDDSFSADIRDEMDTDMSEGGMPQGEIESCLNHWNNKYTIQRKNHNT